MAISAYEKLFNSMKNEFTVTNDNCEYSIGDYLRMKADEKNGKIGLPMTLIGKMPGAVSRFVRTVEDSLAVTEMPAPEKTIKAFPARTAFSALLTAFVVLSLGVSFLMPGVVSRNNEAPTESVMEVVEETEIPDFELEVTKL